MFFYDLINYNVAVFFRVQRGRKRTHQFYLLLQDIDLRGAKGARKLNAVNTTRIRTQKNVLTRVNFTLHASTSIGAELGGRYGNTPHVYGTDITKNAATFSRALDYRLDYSTRKTLVQRRNRDTNMLPAATRLHHWTRYSLPDGPRASHTMDESIDHENSDAHKRGRPAYV